MGDSSQRTLPPLLVLLAAADALRRTCKVDATGDTMDGSYRVCVAALVLLRRACSAASSRDPTPHP